MTPSNVPQCPNCGGYKSWPKRKGCAPVLLIFAGGGVMTLLSGLWDALFGFERWFLVFSILLVLYIIYIVLVFRWSRRTGTWECSCMICGYKWNPDEEQAAPNTVVRHDLIDAYEEEQRRRQYD